MIDLGQIRPGDYEPPPRPPERRAPKFRAIAAVLAVVLCGGVVGTAPPSWLPAVHRIGPLLEDRPTTNVIDDLLLDLDFERGVLRALELDGRGLRWQVGFEPGTWPSIQQAGGLAIVTLQWPMASDEGDGDIWTQVRAAGIRALDLHTGAEVWRFDGFTISPVDRGLVVVQGTGDWIAGVDVATGVEIWRREWRTRIRTVALEGPGDRPDRTVTIAAADGTIEALDPMTGEVRRAARVRPGNFEVYTMADLIGVNYQGDGGLPVHFVAYRFGQDRQLWQRALRPGYGGLWPCSETTLCVQVDAGTTQHLDPWTGREVATPPELLEPTQPEPWTGGWELIGELAGHRLATRRNIGPAPYFTWLGVQTADGIRPLMRIAEGIVFCSVADPWLVCNDDQVPRNAYAVRAPDLERLIAELT